MVTVDSAAGQAVLPYVRRVTDLAYPVTTGQAIGSSPNRRIVTDYAPEGFPVDKFGNPQRSLGPTRSASSSASTMVRETIGSRP